MVNTPTLREVDLEVCNGAESVNSINKKFDECGISQSSRNQPTKNQFKMSSTFFDTTANELNNMGMRLQNFHEI